MLPETDKAEALAVAERIRSSIAALHFDAPGGGFRVTVSIGVETERADRSELPSLMKRADAALYRAKREGRNRISAA